MRIFLIHIFILLAAISSGKDVCLLDQEPPKRLVVDLANILNPAAENDLELRLEDFNRKTSNQILVVTVNDLCGYDRAEFTYTLGEKWQVGQKEFNNGVVIMVKPHGSAGNRHAFIAVGYGLEGAIPDAISKRIVELEMIPAFKSNDFEGGINNAVNTVMGLAQGEINAAKYGKGKWVPIFPLFIVLLIIFMVLFSAVRRIRKYSFGRDISFWTALWLLSQMGHRRGGGWNNFHSGSGNFGGFGGFGGGSFGGGGAGGSW